MAVIVDEACHPKCCCGVISRHREQQLVDFARKVRAITRSCNQASFGVDANRDDDAATSLRVTTEVANGFPARQATVVGKLLLQPFRKCRPSASSCDFNCGAPVGIAQPHKCEVETQCIDQHGKPAGDGARPSADPGRRDGRQCYEIPDRRPQPQSISLETDRHRP